MNRLLLLRNLWSWTGIGIEELAVLPPTALDYLAESVRMKDPGTVLAVK